MEFESLVSLPQLHHLYFGCSEKVAHQALKASDWHLEGALDVFYSQPQVKSSADKRRLEELYNRYKGNLLRLYNVCV